ncbi:MAG: hypothetical protein MJY99_02190 [Fibrobacter sp.]|nr:hypothetical protein [Fibrobacter sp.]
MKKTMFFVLVLLTLIFVSCAEDEGWNASDVCPEAGTNRYGMPNRGTFVDERDGREYKYTTIGDQVWMAENLKYELPYPYSMCYGQMTCKEEWWGDTTCTRDTAYLAEIAQKMQSACTDNDCIAKEYCETFGRYYSLKENGGQKGLLNRSVVDSICPEGWHVPNKMEWESFGESIEWETSRVTSNDSSLFDNQYISLFGEDDCGFTTLFAGYQIRTGFYQMFKAARFGTSSSIDANFAYTFAISTSVRLESEVYMYSIRCVKD